MHSITIAKRYQLKKSEISLAERALVGLAAGCCEDICDEGVMTGVFMAFIEVLFCCDGIERRLSNADMFGLGCCCCI